MPVGQVLAYLIDSFSIDPKINPMLFPRETFFDEPLIAQRFPDSPLLFVAKARLYLKFLCGFINPTLFFFCPRCPIDQLAEQDGFFESDRSG
jgi:hypothetical protein